MKGVEIQERQTGDRLKIETIDRFSRLAGRDRNRRGVRAVAVIGAAILGLSACAPAAGSGADNASSDEPTYAYEAGTIYMGSAEEGSKVHTSGAVVAGVINNTVPGMHVSLQESEGAMINAVNVCEGDLELAIIAGDVAYDAYFGENAFAGNPQEDLRVLAACYQEVSGWEVLASSEMTGVSDLTGRIVSAGSRASATDQASQDVFAVIGADASNTEIYYDSLNSSTDHVRRGTADAAHAFAHVPFEAHQALAGETAAAFLAYTEEQLAQIVGAEPRYVKTEIPANTYPGQEEAVPTFGIKVLLCADKDMDEDLAYEIARAMDLNGPVYAAGHAFMSKVQDKQFLCNDLPIPLHEGAETYYRELGYLEE